MSAPEAGSRPAAAGFRRAAGVACVLVAALAALEFLARTVLVPASKDLGRFSTYDARAEALAAAAPPRLALIGNSSTERGIDLRILEQSFEERTGVPLDADMFVADASGIRTWYWIVAQEFWRAGRRPDLVVVTYYGGGLEDGEKFEIGRIARYFSGPRDRQEIFDQDLTTFGERADYLLSAKSQLWAIRDRLRERVLLLVPGYRDFASRLNAVELSVRQKQLRPRAPMPVATYETLRRFLSRARREGTRVCFVAFPTQAPRPGAEPYGLGPEALKAITDAGMGHLDLRQVDGLAPRDYEDKVHMNARGRAIYSDRLAGALAPESARVTGPECLLPAGSRPPR